MLGSGQTEKGKTGEEHSKSMLIILTSRGLFTKNSYWQAKWSVLHPTVLFYGNCVKMCEDFARTLMTKELAVASRQCTTSRFLIRREFLTNTTVDSTHPTFLFP
jgi:hypothetical protein